MYVCLCNAVTESAIHEAVDNGVRTVAELRLHTGCSNSCGSCEEMAAETLAQALDGNTTGNLVFLTSNAA